MSLDVTAANVASRRSILGRGCDPVRAAYAKKAWEPVLNVEIDTATSDKQLLQLITSGKQYSVFFIAPGQCQLIREGVIDGDAMEALVRKHQPGIKILRIDHVSKGLPMLAAALGEAPIAGVKPLTADWPFLD